MRAIPWRPRLAIYAASRVYRAIGLELRRRRYDVTQGRGGARLAQAGVGHLCRGRVTLVSPMGTARA